MFSVEADDINRLIKVSWSENVSADEMRECAEQLRALTADMRPGFRLLTDLTGLKSVDPTGASYIAAMMDQGRIAKPLRLNFLTASQRKPAGVNDRPLSAVFDRPNHAQYLLGLLCLR